MDSALGILLILIWYVLGISNYNSIVVIYQADSDGRVRPAKGVDNLRMFRYVHQALQMRFREDIHSLMVYLYTWYMSTEAEPSYNFGYKFYQRTGKVLSSTKPRYLE